MKYYKWLLRKVSKLARPARFFLNIPPKVAGCFGVSFLEGCQSLRFGTFPVNTGNVKYESNTSKSVMRYSLYDIEFDKFIVHHYPDFASLIQEYVKFNYFLYGHPDPDFFKITLNWHVSINHHSGLTIPLADINAEQEIVLRVNKVFGADKMKLEHLITSSYADLQQAFHEKHKVVHGISTGSCRLMLKKQPVTYFSIFKATGMPRNLGRGR